MASNPRMSCCPRTTRWRAYWITNPDNIYRDNVAAGSDSNGFWMSLPEHPNGKFEGTEIRRSTWPRRHAIPRVQGQRRPLQLRRVHVRPEHHRQQHVRCDRQRAYRPSENPADPNSKTVETVFEDLTAYKNRNGGIWGRGEMHTFRNVKLADNAMGYTHASGSAGRDPFTSKVVDSLFVGETENIGNPRTDAEKAYGRSLPKPEMPDFPIRGYEYYDYRHDVENTTFRNYQDNATRKTGALSYLMYTSFGVSSNNAIEHVKFVNAKPVYFPPMERKWGNDNGSSVAWKTAAIHDKDGSLGGGPNSYVLIHDGVNDSIATDAQACEIKPTWNAARVQGRCRAPECWRPAAVAAARGGGPAGAGGAGPGAVLVLAQLAGPARQVPGPARGAAGARLLVQVPVLAHLVVEPAVPVQLLLSRQSFSAAMARSTP